MISRLLRFGRIGLPVGGLAFVTCLVLIHQSPSMPEPAQGMIVPFREGRGFLYISHLLNDAFYASIVLLVVGLLCTLGLVLLKRFFR